MHKCVPGGGTARFLAITFIAMLLIAMLPLGTYAATYEPGDTITYDGFYYKEAANFRSGDFNGACVQAHREMTHGTGLKATINSQLGPSSKYSKVIYYWAYQKGWWDNSDTVYGKTKHAIVDMMLQYATTGEDARDPWTRYYGHSEQLQNYAIACYNEAQAANITVPSRLEVYYCSPNDGTQQFVMWRMTPTGKVKLKKVSANPGVTG